MTLLMERCFAFGMMTCEFLHTLEYIQVSIKVPIFTCFVQLLPSSNWKYVSCCASKKLVFKHRRSAAQFLQKSLKIALRALPSKDAIVQSDGLVLQGLTCFVACFDGMVEGWRICPGAWGWWMSWRMKVKVSFEWKSRERMYHREWDVEITLYLHDAVKYKMGMLCVAKLLETSGSFEETFPSTKSESSVNEMLPLHQKKRSKRFWAKFCWAPFFGGNQLWQCNGKRFQVFIPSSEN